LNHARIERVKNDGIAFLSFIWLNVYTETEQTQKSSQERTDASCTECNECFSTDVRFLQVTLSAVAPESGGVCLWMVQDNKGMWKRKIFGVVWFSQLD